jgi:hypothetical protein
MMRNEDPQVREVDGQEALMAADEQVSKETGDQANSEGNEGEAYDLTDEMEAAIQIEPASEEEAGQ